MRPLRIVLHKRNTSDFYFCFFLLFCCCCVCPEIDSAWISSACVVEIFRLEFLWYSTVLHTIILTTTTKIAPPPHPKFVFPMNSMNGIAYLSIHKHPNDVIFRRCFGLLFAMQICTEWLWWEARRWRLYANSR